METDERELSLTDLEEELVRVGSAKEITVQFLSDMNCLTEEKIKELEILKENLETLKSFEKVKSKRDYVKFLDDRKINLEKAIKQMKEKKIDSYNPVDIILD